MTNWNWKGWLLILYLTDWITSDPSSQHLGCRKKPLNWLFISERWEWFLLRCPIVTWRTNGLWGHLVPKFSLVLIKQLLNSETVICYLIRVSEENASINWMWIPCEKGLHNFRRPSLYISAQMWPLPRCPAEPFNLMLRGDPLCLPCPQSLFLIFQILLKKKKDWAGGSRL